MSSVRRAQAIFGSFPLRVGMLMVTLAAFMAALCLLPATAQAKEYTIDQVDISAWVLEDGTLDVW